MSRRKANGDLYCRDVPARSDLVTVLSLVTVTPTQTIAVAAGDEPGPSVVIIGGGLAGLAAAVGLAKHGVRSQVLESRPRLGGRASSFQDAATGQWIDNCQHVSMGCCTNFRAFCEWTGLAPHFRREETLFFCDPDGRVNRFAATALPAPLHLALAFAGLTYLTWTDKLALGRGIRALAHPRAQTLPGTMQDWLIAQRQPPRVIERFWQVVLVSALSESLDRIAIPAARQVLVEGFLAHRDAWKVDIPRVPLQDLYGETLTNWLQSRGTVVRTLAAVERLAGDATGVTAVQLRDGTSLSVADYVLAVPSQRVAALLPADWSSHPHIAALQQLEPAPITSLHFWFDRPICELPHAVFVQGLVQWVFHRTQLGGPHAAELPGHYYQVVISASRDLLQHPSSVIQQQVLEELSAIFPAARQARVLNVRQVTEHRAVFSPTPDAERHRPPQQSPWANLQLAGDYTQTGWPATMEGAVRSGFLAAENLLRRRGISADLVQPPLPVSRWARLLFGL